MRTKTATGSIIVGVDDSDGSRAATSWAAKAARAHRWPLVLVHAYVDLAHPTSRGFIAPEVELRAEAEDLVDRAQDYLVSKDWIEHPARRIVHPGRPDELLIETSDDARLVVVGRRGTGGFRDMLVGSNAYRVAERCTVPVVIVPQSWEAESADEKPVVLGLDQDSGQEAIAFAFDSASRSCQRLEAIHVFAPPVYVGSGGFGGYWPATEGWTAQRDAAMEERRCLLSEQLAGWGEKYPDVTVDVTVAYGSPTGVLLGKASQSSLLVVGGVDHGRFASVFVGSVARNLMHHASCPLAVVHAAR